MRTFGKTKDCSGCRFWSEMVAMVEDGHVVAMCLAGPDSEQGGKYTHGRQACGAWKSGHHGAVDDPPDYGAETRALYEKEEG